MDTNIPRQSVTPCTLHKITRDGLIYPQNAINYPYTLRYLIPNTTKPIPITEKRIYPYWLQMALHTRVLVKVTKRMKNNHFAVHVPPSILGIKQNKLSHYTQQKNPVGYIFKNPNDDGETRTTILSVFGVWFQPPKIIYLFLELYFFASSWYTTK